MALMASMFTAVTIALGALVPAAATADSCPNAAERFGASGNLPDCRAYELVTPAIKEDNDFLEEIHGFSDGNHVYIESLLPYPGAQNGQVSNTLSTRTVSGWVSTPLTPPQSSGEPLEFDSPDNGGQHVKVMSFTSDFSAGFVDSPLASDPLDQDKGINVYRVDIPSGVSSLASLPDSGPMTDALMDPPGVFEGLGLGAYLAGNSADGRHVFFETAVGLPTAPGTPAPTQGATPGEELYERYADHTYLVGILPDGSLPACGAEIANTGMNASEDYAHNGTGVVSPDGSNVVFRSPSKRECSDGEKPTLYLRENNGTSQAATVQLSGSELIARSADGAMIFTREDLNENIYEYSVPTGQTITIGKGEVVALSPDGSHLYYLANQGTSEAQIYTYENGRSKPVLGENAATGYAGKTLSGSQSVSFLSSLASTTPDGSKFLFLDRADLTSYNTQTPPCEKYNFTLYGTDKGPYKYCSEAYLYNATDGSVVCVSCNPNGTPPVAPAYLYQSVNDRQAADTESPFIAPEMPTLSADGSRAFFETEEALVPQDTNGTYDVYEWENGHPALLSSGHGSYGSYLVGVSSDGNDVFIQSTDNLLPQDVESSQLVYDARVDGGFPYTSPVYGCESGQCQGPQTPAPIFSPPPSSTFIGLGNPVKEEVKPVQVQKPAKRKVTKQKRKSAHKHKVKKAQSKAKSDDSKRRGKK